MTNFGDFVKAVLEDGVAAVHALVKAGADVNARDEEGQTPLLWAAKNDSLAAAKALVKAGADVTICDEYGQSALDRAKSPEMRPLLARAWPHDHPLRLHALAAADLVDEVVDAVAAGADVNARAELGHTPLFWAAEYASLAAAEVLIEAGADVNARDELSRTPLFWAILNGNEYASLHVFEVLIEAGADVNARDEEGQTPIFWAADRDHLAAAEVLVEAGADVTVCANNVQSALDWAYSPEMRQLLARAWPQDHPHQLHALAAADLADEVADAVAAGADVNTHDEQGQTPIFWAAIKNNLAAAEVLVKAGADVNARANDGRTPLFCAIDNDNQDVASTLIKAGADVNARGEDGWTPLFWAAENDSLAIAEVLIKAGADATIRDEDGQCALDRAISSEMEELLVYA